MSNSYRNNGWITDFWLDDSDDEIYIDGTSGVSLQYVSELVHDKWGVELTDVSIRSENIHTGCLTYDLHDSSDYTNFIVITRNK